jgi:hypothetical protein
MIGGNVWRRGKTAMNQALDPTVNYRGAHRELTVILLLALLGISIGGTFDALWHATQPFDGFWSPPHIVIYVTFGMMWLLTLRILYTERFRRAFGEGFAVPGLPFTVPGPVFILTAGMFLIGFAGLVLDNFWHSRFGLNETGWSFPHAMLAWTLLVAMLGAFACRLALRVHRPLRWYTLLFYGGLVVSASAAPMMGPLHGQHTPETAAFVARLPALAAQPEFQHAYRIGQTWNLNRTNPLLMLLAPLWGGAVLAFLLRFDSRWWIVLLVIIVWGALDNRRNSVEQLSQLALISDVRANYAELPIFLPAVGVLLLRRLRVSDQVIWLLAGAGFGALIFDIWGTAPLAFWLILLSAPLMLFGARLGERGYEIVSDPGAWQTVRPVILMAVIVPLLTGIVDLYLRWQTP